MTKIKKQIEYLISKNEQKTKDPILEMYPYTWIEYDIIGFKNGSVKVSVILRNLSIAAPDQFQRFCNIGDICIPVEEFSSFYRFVKENKNDKGWRNMEFSNYFTSRALSENTITEEQFREYMESRGKEIQ
jgi:hypothetical protein